MFPYWTNIEYQNVQKLGKRCLAHFIHASNKHAQKLRGILLTNKCLAEFYFTYSIRFVNQYE